MRGLAVSNGTSPSCRPGPTQLAEARLRGLVHTDSKPISSKNSQSSGSGDPASSLPEHDGNQLTILSEVGMEGDILRRGGCAPTQVFMLGAESTGLGVNQDLMSWSAMDSHTTEWSYHSSNDSSHQSYIHNRGTVAPTDVLRTMGGQQHKWLPGYFQDYHDQLLGRDDDYRRRSLPIGGLAGLACPSNM